MPNKSDLEIRVYNRRTGKREIGKEAEIKTGNIMNRIFSKGQESKPTKYTSPEIARDIRYAKKIKKAKRQKTIMEQ